jgi:hypothetical protein
VEFEEMFRSMEDDADKRDGETYCATGFYSVLQDFDFSVVLKVFS